MTTIKNYTPHDVVVIQGENRIVFKSDGIIRLSMRSELSGIINGIPLTKTEFGEPEGLPKQEEGVYLIVSQIVQSAVKRADLLVPSDIVRDDKGNIIGCKSLGII